MLSNNTSEIVTVEEIKNWEKNWNNRWNIISSRITIILFWIPYLISFVSETIIEQLPKQLLSRNAIYGFQSFFYSMIPPASIFGMPRSFLWILNPLFWYLSYLIIKQSKRTATVLINICIWLIIIVFNLSWLATRLTTYCNGQKVRSDIIIVGRLCTLFKKSDFSFFIPYTELTIWFYLRLFPIIWLIILKIYLNSQLKSNVRGDWI